MHTDTGLVGQGAQRGWEPRDRPDRASPCGWLPLAPPAVRSRGVTSGGGSSVPELPLPTLTQRDMPPPLRPIDVNNTATYRPGGPRPAERPLGPPGRPAALQRCPAGAAAGRGTCAELVKGGQRDRLTEPVTEGDH